MEGLKPDDPLAVYLAANRAHANAVFAQARRRSARVTPETFSEFVCGPLARLVHAVAARSPAHASRAAGGLYEVAAELFGQNLLGTDTRSPAVADLWNRVLPQVARWLADDPRGVAAALSNIAYNVERDGVAGRWAEWVAGISQTCDTTQTFLDAALVLAWRSGLAHYRESALERWRQLPPPIGMLTLGLPADRPGLGVTEVEQHLADPWWTPALDGGAGPAELHVVARVGGFLGIDGPFVRPPQVACSQGTILAFDREGCWSVHADCFGACLRRAGTGPPDRTDLSSPGFIVTASGSVTRRGLTCMFPELRGVTGFASTEWTLAVTLRHSHRVHLVAFAQRGRS